MRVLLSLYRTSDWLRFYTLCGCIFIFLPHNTLAETPKQTINTTVDRVIAVLHDPAIANENRKQIIKDLAANHFDFSEMSRRVLAINWKNATVAHRSRFTELFKELLTDTYWEKISGHREEAVSYVGERVLEDLATVNTLIQTATANIPVDYKLHLRHGIWYTYDVVIEQVSLVRNYRGRYQTLVHDQGIEGLLRHMEDQLRLSADRK